MPVSVIPGVQSRSKPLRWSSVRFAIWATLQNSAPQRQ